jgi:hypothetical protein
MASLGNINATGKSGKQYSFALYSLNTDFEALGAVYIFLRGTDPVYVGETSDLSERFDGHHKAQEIRVHCADRIGVLLEGSGDRRLAIESDLLRNYTWPCNG